MSNVKKEYETFEELHNDFAYGENRKIEISSENGKLYATFYVNKSIKLSKIDEETIGKLLGKHVNRQATHYKSCGSLSDMPNPYVKYTYLLEIKEIRNLMLKREIMDKLMLFESWADVDGLIYAEIVFNIEYAKFREIGGRGIKNFICESLAPHYDPTVTISYRKIFSKGEFYHVRITW